MRAALRIFFLWCVVTVAAFGQSSPQEKVLWLTANRLRLKVEVFAGAKLSARPMLIVVLHGDLPNPTYHYAFARQVAAKTDDVVVAAVLRPGYSDGADRSEGEQGLTTGDNYTPQVVDAVAEVLDQLKAKYHPLRTILVGHSGGAAITGDVVGRHPLAADAALMVSCPCDLVAWRKHMGEIQKSPIWSAPVSSLSPIDLVGGIRKDVPVRLVVGEKDPVAPPELTRRYADSLRRRGHDVTVTLAPRLEHNILLEPVSFDALRALVQHLKRLGE